MKLTPETINWKIIKAVIFDVDGTLYNQRNLRKIMAFELLKSCMLRTMRWREIKIISCFRKERERRALEDIADLDSLQYIWAAEALNTSPEKVKEVIGKWMYKAPLKYLRGCCFPEAARFMEVLRQKGIITAVFSDYPSAEKLQAMGMKPEFIVSATDKNIDRLKPDPKGLLVLTEQFKISPENCLFIGDRDDRDGECARRAGMPYLILEKGHANDEYLRLIRSLNDTT